MKWWLRSGQLKYLIVAPARERGLKWVQAAAAVVLLDGRSREGAWIEILIFFDLPPAGTVAPARERGLKSALLLRIGPATRRSREGAWIEISKRRYYVYR